MTSLDPEERKAYEDDMQPYEFGHTLEDQIGGQLAAGFVITGFYEDVLARNGPCRLYAGLRRHVRQEAAGVAH